MELHDYHLTAEYHFGSTALVQFYLDYLSHYSYLIVNDGQALLVDPGRDIDVYLDYLKKHGIMLKAIFLTHSHADFVAGHMEASHRTGAVVYISEAAHAEYPHMPLKDNDILQIGSATVRFISTPGHTLDGMCALLLENGKKQFLLTGDTLFVGSVGRPDLMGGIISAAELAEMEFRSWTDKLAILPDDLPFYPAHGAGSLCGANLGNQPYSTIGQQKRDNEYLKLHRINDFIAQVLNNLPEAPQYFHYDAQLNRKGPELVDWNAPIRYAYQNNCVDAWIVDVRDDKRYAAGHLSGAINIGLDGHFENWVGTLVPPEAKLILAGDSENEIAEGLWRLQRIGYCAKGLLVKQGMALRSSGWLQPAQVQEKMRKNNPPMVVDVRNPAEFTKIRIGAIVNLPLTHLAQSCSKLQKTMPTITVCHSAYRSSMAVGILERAGFTDVSSLAGGTAAWEEAGLPTIQG